MTKASKKPKTYGELMVTEAELETAKHISVGNDAMADNAYQLVRYCLGAVCIREDAEKALRFIRQ